MKQGGRREGEGREGRGEGGGGGERGRGGGGGCRRGRYSHPGETHAVNLQGDEKNKAEKVLESEASCRRCHSKSRAA